MIDLRRARVRQEVCKQQVVSASFDKTMLVWSLRTKSCERVRSADPSVFKFAVARAATRLRWRA